MFFICRTISNLLDESDNDEDDNGEAGESGATVVHVELDADTVVEGDGEPARPISNKVPGKRTVNAKKEKPQGEYEKQIMEFIHNDKEKTNDDEDMMFLKSLHSNLKSCGKNKALVKIKIMQLLMENEANNIPAPIPVPIASTSTAQNQNTMGGGGGGGNFHGYQNFDHGYTQPNNFMYNQQAPQIIHDGQRTYANM